VSADFASPLVKPSFFSLQLLDNRYPVLHGLRAIAILSVIQYHVSWILGPEEGFKFDPAFLGAAVSVFFGMDLFFILSGFLIGSILLHSLETTGQQNIRRFYLRRIFRTFPSYYLVLTALALTQTLTAVQKHNLIHEYLYLTNFFSLRRIAAVMPWGWSLAFEEQFYLTVPLLFFVLTRLSSHRARVILLLALWSIPLFVRLAIFYRQPIWNDADLSRNLYFSSYTRFDTILCGILLAFFEQRFRPEVDRFFASPLRKSLALLVSAACLWFLLQPALFGPNTLQIGRVFLWGTVTSIMYFGFLLAMLRSEGPFARAMSHPMFRRIATLGYGVYLVHLPLIDKLAVPIAKRLVRRGAPLSIVWTLSMVVVTAASLAIAYLLHILVEKPSLRLRDRLAA
jgi:peptidoglycan/LPS O-acetylase OafA/YrhL